MKQTKIISIILLAFSIEYLSFGELSIYRVIILPLSLYGLFKYRSLSGSASKYNVFVLFFMIYFALCCMYTETNPLFAVLCLPFMLYIGNTISSGVLSKVNVARIFSLYSLPHIFAYIFLRQYAFLEEGRFNGLHIDSNFCGIYLLVALAASSNLLLFSNEHRYEKLFDFLNCIVCFYFIFITASRGALVTCLLLVAFLLFKSNLNKIFKYFIVVAIMIGSVYLDNYIDSLPIFVSADDGYVDFILSRFKEENLEGGSNRIDFWSMAFSAIFKEAPYIPVGTNFLGRIFYTHNSYIDLLLELGLIQGSLFICFYVFNLFTTLKYILKPCSIQEMVIYAAAIIVSISLFILSADRAKLFWLMVCFIIYRPTFKRIHE